MDSAKAVQLINAIELRLAFADVAQGESELAPDEASDVSRPRGRHRKRDSQRAAGNRPCEDDSRTPE
jgi:hypothetical protein